MYFYVKIEKKKSCAQQLYAAAKWHRCHFTFSLPNKKNINELKIWTTRISVFFLHSIDIIWCSTFSSYESYTISDAINLQTSIIINLNKGKDTLRRHVNKMQSMRLRSGVNRITFCVCLLSCRSHLYIWALYYFTSVRDDYFRHYYYYYTSHILCVCDVLGLVMWLVYVCAWWRAIAQHFYYLLLHSVHSAHANVQAVYVLPYWWYGSTAKWNELTTQRILLHLSNYYIHNTYVLLWAIRERGMHGKHLAFDSIYITLLPIQSCGENNNDRVIKIEFVN